jgi:hypothetical protein
VAIVVLSFLALPSARGRPRFVLPALVVGSLMFLSLGHVPFSNYPNFSRAATELVTVAVLVGLWGRGRPADLSLVTLGGGGLVLAGWAVWATTPL